MIPRTIPSIYIPEDDYPPRSFSFFSKLTLGITKHRDNHIEKQNSKVRPWSNLPDFFQKISNLEKETKEPAKKIQKSILAECRAFIGTYRNIEKRNTSTAAHPSLTLKAYAQLEEAKTLKALDLDPKAALSKATESLALSTKQDIDALRTLKPFKLIIGNYNKLWATAGALFIISAIPFMHLVIALALPLATALTALVKHKALSEIVDKLVVQYTEVQDDLTQQIKAFEASLKTQGKDITDPPRKIHTKRLPL